MTTNSKCAFVDIGSNAIRAVVYSSNHLGAYEIYNDKFKADVRSLLNITIDSKHHIYLILQQLMHVFKKLQVTKITTVATAVLRDHPKAEEFIKYTKDNYGMDIQILSGEEEAILGSSGVLYGVSGSRGLVADLGGGSLEIAEIGDFKVGKRISLPIGTKQIVDMSEKEVYSIIKNALVSSEFVSKKYQSLYFIGGSLRMLGRVYIDLTKYPLKNLHNLEIYQNQFNNYIETIDNQISSQFKGKPKKIKNADHLPHALKVAKCLVKELKHDKIVISNYGLKEGLFYTHLSDSEKKKNVIFERIINMVPYKQYIDFNSYHRLLNILLLDVNSSNYFVFDMALLLIGGFYNIDLSFKAHMLSELILATDIPFKHTDRIMLAIVLHTAFGSECSKYLVNISKRLLSKQNYDNACVMGHFISICMIVDGPTFNKPEFELKPVNNIFELSAGRILSKPIFDQARSHLKEVAFLKKKATGAISWNSDRPIDEDELE